MPVLGRVASPQTQQMRAAEREALGLPDLSDVADTRSVSVDALTDAVVYEHGPLSCREVGLVLGLSKQRVEQIQNESFPALARALREYRGHTRGRVSAWEHADPESPCAERLARRHLAVETSAPEAEPMDAAFAELERIERRMRAVIEVLDRARVSEL